MGAIGPGGGVRRERESTIVLSVIGESTLGIALMTAMIAKQACVEAKMLSEAAVFEEAIQKVKNEMNVLGLDPDKVLAERLRLLRKASKKSS